MADTRTPLVRCPRALGLTVGLWALGLSSSAHLLHNSPFGRSLSSLRALAKSLPGSGLMLQTLRSAASARLTSSRGFEAARSAPDWRPIPSLRSVIPRPPVVRASRLTQHRISRVWGRSFRSRSLGLAPAAAVTSSVSAGALPSPSAALGRLITALRPFGGLRKLLALGSESFCWCLQSVCDLGESLDSATANSVRVKQDGLRVLAHSKSQ
jgi:hypothetical protein